MRKQRAGWKCDRRYFKGSSSSGGGGRGGGGGAPPRRLSDYGNDRQRISRLMRNRNLNSVRNVAFGSNVFITARERGYTRNEASALTQAVMRAERAGDSARVTRLTRGIFAEFRPDS